MKHLVKIYPGKYEFELHKGITYLHQKGENMHPEDFRFHEKGNGEAIMQAIIELNVDDDRELGRFLSAYGLLVNTLNDSENPTYIGEPTSKETNKYISPFTSGISMPRFLFKHNMKLLKNTLLLCTELSKSGCKDPDFDTEENSINILKLFLSLLFQPYSIYENKWNLQIIVEGITPLSRFASSYYEGVLLLSCMFQRDFFKVFTERFKEITTENFRRRKSIPSILEPPKKESDIPVLELMTDFGCKVSLPTDLECTNWEPTDLKFPEIFYKDTATDEYKILSETLSSITKYCDYSFLKGGHIKLSFKDETAFVSDTQLLTNLHKLSKQLIIDTLNTYTSNIQFKLDDFNEKELTEEEHEKYVKITNDYPNSNSYMYSFMYQSPSLLQAIFLEASSMLNEYGVGICAYPGCNKTVFYKRTRPKRCCSQQHNDLYCKLKKRNPSKLRNR